MIASVRARHERRARNERLFVVLLVLLVIASSNLGLVNIRLGIKASDGGNLVGIRDLFLALSISFGVLLLLREEHTALRNPHVKITLLIVALSPAAALVGVRNNGQYLAIARDFVTMLGWLLAYVVGSNLRTSSALRTLCTALLWMGAVISLGVFVEAASSGQLRVVTPADVVAESRRSTPSGWPLMMVSASLAMTNFLLDRKLNTRQALANFFVWSLVLVASLLTQSRTLLVGLIVGAVSLLVMSFLLRVRRVRYDRLLILVAVIPVGVAVTLVLGERLLRTDFADYFTQRYSVLSRVDTLVEYSEQDTRRAETEMGFKRYIRSPLLGLGLGSRYRDELEMDFGKDDPAILVHNVFAFFLFRYGPLGLFLFLLFGMRVLISLRDALRDEGALAPVGIGLSVGLANLIACGFFGNVFATSYGVPISMVTLGALIGYEEYRSATQTRTIEDIPNKGLTHMSLNRNLGQ